MSQARAIIESEAKDFIKGLGQKPTMRQFGEYQQMWRIPGASILAAGNQILAIASARSEDVLVRVLHGFVEAMRIKGYQDVRQFDMWGAHAEETHAVHRAIGKLIEMGVLEEGPSRGDWNFFPIVRQAQAEALEA